MGGVRDEEDDDDEMPRKPVERASSANVWQRIAPSCCVKRTILALASRPEISKSRCVRSARNSD